MSTSTEVTQSTRNRLFVVEEPESANEFADVSGNDARILQRGLGCLLPDPRPPASGGCAGRHRQLGQQQITQIEQHGPAAPSVVEYERRQVERLHGVQRAKAHAKRLGRPQAFVPVERVQAVSDASAAVAARYARRVPIDAEVLAPAGNGSANSRRILGSLIRLGLPKQMRPGRTDGIGWSAY